MTAPGTDRVPLLTSGRFGSTPRLPLSGTRKRHLSGAPRSILGDEIEVGNMDDWHPIPGNALLSLRRQTVNGERWQWAVTASGDEVVVKHARFGEGNWSELDGSYSDLQDALRGNPELCAVRKGTINEYTLDCEEMEPARFVQLLDLGPADGDENPNDRPADVASDWEWMRSSMERYSVSMLLRWATIDGDEMWITGVHGGTFSAVAINEDEGGYAEPLHEIARCWWAFDNTGAPISWAGGYILDRVAPELACSRPDNDEAELAGDGAYRFIELPKDSEKSFADVIAQWIIDNDAEVGAALSFEEFDPDCTLDEDERRAWESVMYGVELGVSADECGGLLRESIAELSSLYCDTRDALANPRGDLGQRLLAAYGEGSLYLIRSGSWASND